MPARPDAVLSGINYGFNVASDIQYSATAGAAFEGAFQGYPSVSISEDAKPDHRITDLYLDKILAKVLFVHPPEGCIWSVNIPCCAPEDFRGILWERTVSRGMFYRDSYTETPLPDGGIRLMVNGVYNEDAEEGTDFRAVTQRYASVGYARNIT